MTEQIKNILDTLLDDSKYEEYGVVLYTYVNRLEEQLEPKTCDACGYHNIYPISRCNNCTRFYKDYYEPKDSK
jgi:predicted Zn-ribbon and HTH transcriptional regulator